MFEKGLRETERVLGLKQVDRRKLYAMIILAVLIIGVAVAIAYYYGVLPGLPYTGAATLKIFVKPASGLPVTSDEYLGPASYWVLDPTDNSTIASGSITSDDDWQKEVDIEAGHPGYVWVAVTPPNNTYYLYKPLGDESVIISGIKYYKVPITKKEVSVTAYFIKFGNVVIESDGSLTLPADTEIFTTNIIYNVTPEAALYNLTLIVSFNVTGLKIDYVTLNGSTIEFYHLDKDNDDVIDANEKIYIWLSGQDFVANLESKNVTYVLAITYSNGTAFGENETVAASLTFIAYKFDKDLPYVFDEMTKVTLTTDTAYYSK